jgi:hypothetical protein
MNIEQKIELLQAQLDELREQHKNQRVELDYPVYMQHTVSKAVVRFTGLKDGVVVVAQLGKGMYDVGFSTDVWAVHTDRKIWTPILFDEERGIADKQLCEVWDNSTTHVRCMRFYDAINKGVYSSEGKRAVMLSYDNYTPIPYNNYPEWAWDAQYTLED